MIKIENLTKTYLSGFFKNKTNEVLKEIKLDIKKETIVGLIGNSGSGKSTLAKILCGMESYQAGSIFLNNKTLKKGEYSNKINIIFQHPESSFNPRMSMYKNLLEILKIKKLYKTFEREKIIEEYTELVGLNKDLLNRKVNELSGGEAQRFSIVRALITKSNFLILDECTSMLDISTQLQILKLLKNLQIKKKLTYLFISHDLEIAKFFCDYIYILHEGKIIEEGVAQKIFERPKEKYTKELVKIFNKLNIKNMRRNK